MRLRRVGIFLLNFHLRPDSVPKNRLNYKKDAAAGEELRDALLVFEGRNIWQIQTSNPYRLLVLGANFGTKVYDGKAKRWDENYDKAAYALKKTED